MSGHAAERERDGPRAIGRPVAQVRLRRPVVSVGNLAVGGRGKTPLVAHVARLLLDAGERPSILSRGYGRRRVEDGAVVVSDGAHVLADLDRAGDEPLMLARRLPGAVVVVCDQRAIAGALAERVLGATVHVLDDGFQHRALARDVDIVIMRERDFADRRMPFGRLREPVRALRRADAVVIEGRGPAAKAQGGADGRRALWDDATGYSHWAFDGGRAEQSAWTLPSFAAARRLGNPVPLEPERRWPGRADGVVALAGIAEPRRFADMLAAQGLAVARVIDFRDHHRYTVRDLEAIARVFEASGASAVLTTEKDAMRLLPLRPFPIPIAAVPLEMTIDPDDAFRQLILSRLSGRTR